MLNMLRITMFIFVCSILTMGQQVPNGGFEEWSGVNPIGWSTSNAEGVAVPVTQSNDAHSGSSSAKLEVVDFVGFPYPPLLETSQDGEFGIPVSGRPGSVTGYYKYAPAGENDALIVVVGLYRNSFQEAVGGGSLYITSAAPEYTPFIVPIMYFSENNPDTAEIVIAIADTGNATSATIGSVAYVDDIAFGGATAVEDNDQFVRSFSLKQNYPNPFNPSTTISFTLAERSYTTLKIFDVLGNEVMTLINDELDKGAYSVPFSASKAELSSGVYYYTLKTGSFVSTKKMVLLK